MKAWWNIQAARINALSVRERLFLLLSVLLVLGALADVLWLTPAQTAYKQTQQRFLSQSTELNRLRAELAVVAKPVDASADLQADIAHLQTRTQALRAEIAGIAPALSAGGEALEPVLEQFLQRSSHLRLVSSATLGVEAIGPGVQNIPGMMQRGLELKVSGPYAELIRYVQRLEQALPSLRWGSMQLRVDQRIPELTLRVYVLEVQP